MGLIRVVPICEAVIDMLRNDLELMQMINDRNIVHNEAMNADPNKTPWIGVYPSASSDSAIEPYVLGTKSFINNVGIDINIQSASLTGKGATAFSKLEDILTRIVDIVEGDPRLKNSVKRVRSMKIGYSYLTREDIEGPLYFPMVTLTINAEVRHGG